MATLAAEFRHRLFLVIMWAMVPVALTVGDIVSTYLPAATYMEVTERPPIYEDDPRTVRRTPNVTANPLTEDSVGWDCRTMGNRICGERGQLPNTR